MTKLRSTRRLAWTLLLLGFLLVTMGATAQAAVNDQIPAAEGPAEGTATAPNSSSSTFVNTSSSTVIITSSSSAPNTSSSSDGSSTSSSNSADVSDSDVSTASSDPDGAVIPADISTSSGIGGTLARTGADPGILLVIGGALIVAGVLVLRYRQRLA